MLARRPPASQRLSPYGWPKVAVRGDAPLGRDAGGGRVSPE